MSIKNTATMLTLCAILSSNPANAKFQAFLDGNDIKYECKSGSSVFCSPVMFAAMSDAILYVASEKKLFCMPSVKAGQIRDIVVKYMDDHPEITHEGFAYIFVEALGNAFPC